MKKQIVALAILLLLLVSFPVYAGAPTDAVRLNVNKGFEVLRDPKLKAESAREAKKEKLRLIYNNLFDDVEMGKRTLSKNWNNMNTAQRQEFVILFRQVLEKAYIDKILAYSDEKVVFDRETMVSPTQAEVFTKVVTASQEIPISYRVLLKDGAWKVYDVVIENVSLVLNYRTQFNDILAKNTPEQLLEILRKKVKGQ
ncbi:MAG: ABC transporter substrate-binding protein [Deltaproteobacteria bacterium]|nr:ABC transporter substrate-binding protein [Deltaproteobacteria bacterium]